MTDKETTVTSCNTEKEKVKCNAASIDLRTPDVQINIYCQSETEPVKSLKKDALEMFEKVLKDKPKRKHRKGYE